MPGHEGSRNHPPPVLATSEALLPILPLLMVDEASFVSHLQPGDPLVGSGEAAAYTSRLTRGQEEAGTDLTTPTGPIWSYRPPPGAGIIIHAELVPVPPTQTRHMLALHRAGAWFTGKHDRTLISYHHLTILLHPGDGGVLLFINITHAVA